MATDLNSILSLTSDSTIANAIKDIILVQEIEPGMNIVPQTALSNDVQIGDQTLNVADPTQFIVGGLIVFQDNLGEEPLLVGDITGNTLTINFDGVGYTGFRYPHTAQTTVYTNLFINAPNFVDPMLDNGDPFIFVMIADEQENLVAMRQIQSTYTVNIEYRRQLARGSQQQMNTNIWAFRQQAKARADLDHIANAIRTNPRLQTSSGIHAESLGDKTNSQAWITKNWRKLITDAGVQEFIATMQVLVRAIRESF